MKLRFQKQEAPILTVNLIIHYKYLKILKDLGFNFIWFVATEMATLLRWNARWHSVSTFDSDKNFQLL